MVRAAVYILVIILAVAGFSPVLLVYAFLALIAPGLVLTAAPTVALYLPFADMAVTGWRSGRRRWLVAGLAGGLTVALAPFALSSFLLPADVGPAIAEDFAGAPASTPSNVLIDDHLRIVSNRPSYRQYAYDGSRGADCEDVCAQLLLGGQVTSVARPYARPDNTPLSLGGGYRGDAIVYTASRGEGCQEAEGEGHLVVKDEPTRTALTHRLCVHGRRVTNPTFDAALTQVTEVHEIGRMNLLQEGLAEIRRKTAWTCSGAECRRIAVATSVDLRPVAAPLVIGVEQTGPIEMSRAWWRWKRTVHPVTPQQFLERSFQLKTMQAN